MGGVSKIRKTHFSHLDSENDPKKLPKRPPVGLLNRFKTHPKWYLNSIKNVINNWSRKYWIYGPKLVTFLALLAPKINLQRHLEPRWAPKLNYEKRNAEVLKIDKYCADIDLETNKNEEFQAPKKAISESMWLRLNEAAKPFKRPGGMRGAIE